MKNLIVIVFALLTLGSCKKKDPVEIPPPPAHDEEIITTLRLAFSESNGDTTFTSVFRDPDGEGGNAPVQFDTIRLGANKIYVVSISILNETTSPAEDLTSEIQSEGDEHIFCFTSSVPGLSFVKTDSDGTHPIGLQTEWSAGNPATGAVTVTLKHQPDGDKDGTCAPGETDIEVTFVTEVE